MRAAHLGLRSTAESLLRHAARIEGEKVNGEGTLRDLEQTLRKTKKVTEDFWVHLVPVQRFGNRDAHSQSDDVYHQAGLRPAHDPWTDLELCLTHLAMMAREFVIHWPPPQGLLIHEPAAPKADEEEEQSSQPTRVAPVATDAQVVGFVGNMSASQALADDDSRGALEQITGLTRGGVTRRLNAAHGRTKVRNVFPERFPAPPRTPTSSETEVDDDEGSPFDYEMIGNLTISQAREYGMAESIARLTSTTELSVKRRLGQVNGNGVVRRQFSWYESSVIGELTARTALDYRMAPLLARHLRKRAPAIADKLRGAAGQTKLRTLFPELED